MIFEKATGRHQNVVKTARSGKQSARKGSIPLKTSLQENAHVAVIFLIILM
jgi:hypothetical protein